MSHNNNLVTGSLRVGETGHEFVEICTNSNLSNKEILARTVLRVSAVNTVTVTLDGVLCCTLQAGEVILLNTGRSISKTKNTKTLTTTGNAYIQASKEVER